MSNTQPFKVVIAGAGVAGIEAALALRELAGDAVAVTLLSPNRHFSYRPLAVYEPFDRLPTPEYEVRELAEAAGAELMADSFKWLEPAADVVHTAAGSELHYDALLLALGARRYAQVPYALTLNPATLGLQLRELVQEVTRGVVRRVAFIVPSGEAWPLPAYELALLLTGRARQAGVDAAITVVTAEAAPLERFGRAASDATAELLSRSGVRCLAGSPAQVHDRHTIKRVGSPSELTTDRIVALPELSGPSVPGVPTDSRRGFVTVDRHSRVRGLERVFAAGDMTAHPLKHGGLAAEQADAAAEMIAVLAGARVSAAPSPEIAHAMLVGADETLYLRAQLIGGVTTSVQAGPEPLWEHPEKLHARYLSPVLAHLRERASRPRRQPLTMTAAGPGPIDQRELS